MTSPATTTREGRRLHRISPPYRAATPAETVLPPPDDPCHRRDQKVKLWPQDFARIRQFMAARGLRSEAAAIRELLQEGLHAHGL